MKNNISGVYIYGGGPVRHYVFTGEQQRRRRTRIVTLLLGIILAVLVFYSVHLVLGGVSQPETATANVVAAQADASNATAPHTTAPDVQVQLAA